MSYTCFNGGFTQLRPCGYALSSPVPRLGGGNGTAVQRGLPPRAEKATEAKDVHDVTGELDEELLCKQASAFVPFELWFLRVDESTYDRWTKK